MCIFDYWRNKNSNSLNTGTGYQSSFSELPHTQEKQKETKCALVYDIYLNHLYSKFDIYVIHLPNWMTILTYIDTILILISF